MSLFSKELITYALRLGKPKSTMLSLSVTFSTSIHCDKRRASEKRTRSIIDESNHNNNKRNKENAFHPYKKDDRSSAAQTSSSSSSSRPPKLTSTEIEIIKACNGCFKCRKIYLPKDHINTEANKKTCNFPSGENYKALTWDFANKLKEMRARDSRKAAKPVASALNTSTSTPSTSSITDANSSDNSNFVASMFGPLASAAVIGNGSFSSEGDISVSQPFKSKHYVWRCSIDGPADEFPLKISTLIDNGAHMVLIRPETVTQLGLETFPLPEPELIDVAISSSTSTQKTLSHYVKFKATSLDGLWTSHTVIAIIAPGLCMPIIFGLPFLEFNEIISDHSLRSCIHKKSGYNLINPALPPPQKVQPPKLRAQLRTNHRLKAEALKDLLATFDDKWGTRLKPCEPVKPLYKLRAVKTRICAVINKEVCKRNKKN
jgi:hypothetical protein